MSTEELIVQHRLTVGPYYSRALHNEGAHVGWWASRTPQKYYHMVFARTFREVVELAILAPEKQDENDHETYALRILALESQHSIQEDNGD